MGRGGSGDTEGMCELHSDSCTALWLSAHVKVHEAQRYAHAVGRMLGQRGRGSAEPGHTPAGPQELR